MSEVEVAALSREVSKLRWENQILRDMSSDYDLHYGKNVFTSLNDLPTPNINPGIQLNLAATWDVHRDIYTGRLHAMGRSYRGPEAYTYGYYMEDLKLFTGNMRLRVLGEMHKRVIEELALKWDIMDGLKKLEED